MTLAASVFGGPWAALAWSLAAAALLVWPVQSQHRRAGRRRTTGRRRVRRVWPLSDGAGNAVRANTPSLGVPILHSPGFAADWLGPLAGAAVGTAAVSIAGVSAAPFAILTVPVAARLIGRLGAGRPRQADPTLPLTLDLLAAALRSGRPLSVALQLAAPAAGPASAAALARVAGLLELGADPAAAWALVDVPALLPVAVAGRRSADSGARLAHGLEQLAADLRIQARSAAEERAQRAGVLGMLPLGLCFLPAFICIGVVPVVVGIAGSALAGLH